jgi:hypothetical protein
MEEQKSVEYGRAKKCRIWKSKKGLEYGRAKKV